MLVLTHCVWYRVLCSCVCVCVCVRVRRAHRAFRHDALLKAQFGSLHTQDYASARTIGVNEASKVAAEHLWDNYQE